VRSSGLGAVSQNNHCGEGAVLGGGINYSARRIRSTDSNLSQAG